MPARSSSPIPAGLSQLAIVRPAEPEDRPGLLVCLAAVPDPRRAEGRRHPLAFILALAACAVLAGAKSLAAITEWAADASPAVLTARASSRSIKRDRPAARRDWGEPAVSLGVQVRVARLSRALTVGSARLCPE
ncbi:transposase family protein [Streptomyces caelestis]|uniref:tRNA C32,U32 (Ribose-2'-O)-methylase TrmJ n=1 Tax=Streptomyces caelestis TaxID=36816 RepID=A0A7W9GXZ4_9ACTN|nr:tRNA C32,U32 (ribose-2'-O)-methylase TrmJ [Streptomyces caelestis]GGW86396.1 hypothetical protein GCM10010320_80070 [Streptomyces caelestis]